MDDLIKDFNIKEVQKAGAIFDLTKLEWVNSQHLSNLSIDEFKQHLKPFLSKIDIDIANHSNVNLLINAMRSSENTLEGIAKSLAPYYKDELVYDTNAISKFLSDNKAVLDDIKDLLLNIDNWTEDDLDNALKTYQKEKNLPVPKVNQPIRIALTGSTKSPSLGLTLSIFGKELSIKRIEDLITYLK